MGFAKTKLIFYVLLAIAIISFSQFLITQQTNGSKYKVILLRIHSVAVLQILMSVFSYIAWKTLRPLPRFVISSGPPLPITTLSIKLNQIKPSLSSASATLKRQKSSEQDLTSYSKVENDSSRKVGETEQQKYWTLWDYIVALYIILCHGSYATNVFLVGTEPHWFSLLCYACLGSIIQLGFAVVFIHLFFFMISRLVKLFCGKNNQTHSHGNNPESDVTYQRNITYMAILYVVIVSVIGFYSACQPPGVKLVDIPIKDLPDNLKNLIIVQLSDIHLGPTVGYSKLKRIIDIAEKQKPGEV